VTSVARALAVLFILLAAASSRPAAAAAQEAIDICSNQPVPPGYLVTATQNRPSCPGYMSTGYNSFTIRLPSQSPNEALDICSIQAVPPGYVVSATQNRPSCPAYQSTGYNSVTLRLPGETGSICIALSVLGREYVVTSRTSRPSCPGYNSTGTNSATYRRLADAAPPRSPALSGAMAPLDRYDRGVYRRLREMEEWLGVDAPSHRPWIASGAGGSTTRAELQVEAGGRYTLVAVCDEDCGDMDLRVLDGSYVVAQDTGVDPDAHLEISPARSGTLTVEAIVHACAQNPCHFGVGAYESRL
jgi:hypothetical protein